MFWPTPGLKQETSDSCRSSQSLHEGTYNRYRLSPWLKKETVTEGEKRKAIFWPTPGIEEETSNSCRFSPGLNEETTLGGCSHVGMRFINVIYHYHYYYYQTCKSSTFSPGLKQKHFNSSTFSPAPDSKRKPLKFYFSPGLKEKIFNSSTFSLGLREET